MTSIIDSFFLKQIDIDYVQAEILKDLLHKRNLLKRHKAKTLVWLDSLNKALYYLQFFYLLQSNTDLAHSQILLKWLSCACLAYVLFFNLVLPLKSVYTSIFWSICIRIELLWTDIHFEYKIVVLVILFFKYMYNLPRIFTYIVYFTKKNGRFVTKKKERDRAIKYNL